jgi:saccharopine dehydrogenase-like NADP-dependent oxidoreductase
LSATLTLSKSEFLSLEMLQSSTAETVSVPASILSLMLLRDQIKHVGVFPCEVLDKEEREIFFAGIRDWDVKIHKQVSTEM